MCLLSCMCVCMYVCMCVYIYIYTCIYVPEGFYFVCDRGKHRNAKRFNFGCNMLSSSPCPKVTHTHNIVPFSKHNITI